MDILIKLKDLRDDLNESVIIRNTAMGSPSALSRAILEGEIIGLQYAILAIERLIDDVETQKEKKSNKK